MMAGSARSWLPDSAFTIDRARRALGAALETWSRAWFSEARVSLTRVALEESPGRDDGGISPDAADGTAIALSPRGKRRLFETICAVDLAELSLGEAEHRAIGAVTREAALDLLKAFDLGVPEPHSGDDKVVRLTVCVGGQELAVVRAPCGAVAARLTSAVARSTTPRAGLVRRSRAIGSASVRLDAIVGRGALALGELNALNPGDIVILDRELEEGIALTLAGSSRVLLYGQLGRDGSMPALHL